MASTESMGRAQFGNGNRAVPFLASGDRVRYSDAFVKSSLMLEDEASATGEVVEVFDSPKMARIRWDTGHINRSLICNLQKTPQIGLSH